jgi:hypothetical protein
MAWRARSTARASISSAIAYSAITMAASGHWPIRKAPVTATVISAAALAAAGVGGAGRLAQALGFQAGGGDGLLDGRPGAVGRVHRQRARAQVEAQAAHRGLALQRAADLGLLAGAVHVGNAQQQGAARRQRREVDRPRRHFTGGAAAIGVGVGVVVPMSMVV